jgi:hypothetical protein
MYTNKNGYVAGALLYLKAIRKMREHVEFEKFLCRTIIDNEKTREFKKKTEDHPDKIHALRYNDERAQKLTAAGRKRNGTT